jgi:hypothetical protein
MQDQVFLASKPPRFPASQRSSPVNELSAISYELRAGASAPHPFTFHQFPNFTTSQFLSLWLSGIPASWPSSFQAFNPLIIMPPSLIASWLASLFFLYPFSFIL